MITIDNEIESARIMICAAKNSKELRISIMKHEKLMQKKINSDRVLDYVDDINNSNKYKHCRRITDALSIDNDYKIKEKDNSVIILTLSVIVTIILSTLSIIFLN